MTTEQIRHRSDILNTQVITRDNGKRLGVVKELLVDIDRREVVAIGLRDSLISIAGMPRYMYLTSIRQMGDVILVDDEDVIEDVDVEAYSPLINSEVITETGELLGRVRGFKFNTDDGKVTSLIIASLGLPYIPEQVLSTYELPIEEIVSSGPNRLIVFEGAEERLNQLSVGLLERLGLGKSPWEGEEEETYFPPATRPENQLGTGLVRTTPTPTVRTSKTVAQPAWDEDVDEDDWQEAEPQPLPRRKQEAMYYEDDEEEDNWSETTKNKVKPPVRYEQPSYSEPESYDDDYVDEYEEEEDAWADAEEPKQYKAPKVNIPEKTKAPEYEDTGY